jgi:uncharacterized repeat protein (TIGR04052 family)
MLERMMFMAIALSISAAALADSRAGEGVDIEIRFDARVGDQHLACGRRFEGVGRTGATITLQDFRVYVSQLRLLRGDGSEQPLALTPDDAFQSARVALLDFENATGNCNGNSPTHTVVRGRAPAGDYVGLAFTLGVPVDLNHQDPTLAPAPLNFSALAWPWRYGYKFTTIDFDTGSPAKATPHGGEASGFSIHLGSVDCGEGSPRTPPESPCTTPNRPQFRLPAFDPASQVVVLDLGALLADTDVTVNDPDSASGCMSGPDDDDCVAIMDRFGLPFRGRESGGQQFVWAAAAD